VRICLVIPAQYVMVVVRTADIRKLAAAHLLSVNYHRHIYLFAEHFLQLCLEFHPLPTARCILQTQLIERRRNVKNTVKHIYLLVLNISNFTPAVPAPRPPCSHTVAAGRTKKRIFFHCCRKVKIEKGLQA
jgi:hypothetical protein